MKQHRAETNTSCSFFSIRNMRRAKCMHAQQQCCGVRFNFCAVCCSSSAPVYIYCTYVPGIAPVPNYYSSVQSSNFGNRTERVCKPYSTLKYCQLLDVRRRSAHPNPEDVAYPHKAIDGWIPRQGFLAGPASAYNTWSGRGANRKA